MIGRERRYPGMARTVSDCRSSHRVALLVLLLHASACLAIVEEDETSYVNLLLRDLDSSNGEQSPAKAKTTQDAENEQVKRFWGIPDTSAVVGRIFNYAIPSDAFTGSIQRFEVAEAGESVLPSWLEFNEDTRTFSGVPLGKDMGQYYISVKAVGRNPKAEGKAPVAKDVFSIEVVEESSDIRRPETGELISRCRSGEAQTVASLVIDLNIDELSTSNRTRLLEAAASFLKLPLKILKLANKGEGQAFDGNAILAGPGNAREQLKEGCIIQWHVGCSMTVASEHKEPINFLEKSAEDGSLAEALGHSVIGWQVTSVFPKVLRRAKRQTDNWGTPVPGVLPTHFPQFTERVDEMEATDETVTPESRIIPTMASPIFTQPSHHHRHHHGEPGHERIGHYRPLESPQMTISPTLHHHHRMNPAVATPYAATPVVVPERPTIHVSPTTVHELMPSLYFTKEVTPVDSLVPSMTPTPVLSVSESPVTTTTTTTSVSTPEVVTTEIKPTKTQVVVEKTKRPPGTPNFKPTIERRIKKLLMVAGKVWRFAIPRGTFVDMEDGDTSNLKLLFLSSERTSIPPTSWIQFDPERQMLYALPLEEHIGKYEFILEAMDSEGATAHDRLEIHVWQHQSARARHHEFSVNLKYNKWQYPITIDWNIEFARKLAKYFGDRNESNIAVQSIQSDPGIFSWTNDSLPAYPCPNEEISELTSRLVDENGEVTKSFKKAMGPDFKVLGAEVSLLGVCHSPGSTTSSTHTNFEPMLRNPIERINTTVGEILRFKVPDDTFYDFEDGSTRYLALTFLTIESMRPPKSSWVQFDPKSQELYGLPFEGDAGRHEYQLVAMDSSGRQVNDVFVIEVHPRPPKRWIVEFSLHIDADYDNFSRDISQKVLVAWKLAKLFDDPDPRYITVNSISKGSVVYAWTNNTLPHDPCPAKTIKKLVKNIFNDNSTLSMKLIEAMLPEFRIIKADAMPLGICLGEFTPTSVTVTTPPPLEKAPPAVTSDDDIYITTIIPAVVIAVMLIVAALVACFLYKKKRKGKMTMQDNNTFIGNRAPVIFGDEMEDKPDPAKPPVIMKEEKPPLAPPDYLRSSASSRDSTPQLDRLDQTNARNTNADLHVDPSPPYQPPPPFTTNRESKNSRPKATPTYRQPPPYMPPVPP